MRNIIQVAYAVLYTIFVGVAQLSCSAIVDTEVGSDAIASGTDCSVDADCGTPGEATNQRCFDGLCNECVVDSDCTSLGEDPNRQCVRGSCFLPGINPCLIDDNKEPITENITTSTIWYPDTCYELKDTIYVTNDSELLIRPGTQVVGLASNASLIVTRGSTLRAEGSSEHPIVFTSGAPIGGRKPGDWGGVALLGNAPINGPTLETSLEGLSDGDNAKYGGLDPDSSCGSLRYVRIEFAGFRLFNNQELNSLTLAGCGRDTSVEYIQTHYGLDDGVEIFGGLVGIKWVVISRAQDDSLDWDLGWRGWAQFVAIMQDERLVGADESRYPGSDWAIEANGYKEIEIYDEGPRSRPMLYNFTIVGPKVPRNPALRLRDGTSLEMRNFLVMNQKEGLWDVEDESAACFQDEPNNAPCVDSEGEKELAVIDGLLLHNMGDGGNTYVRSEEIDNDNGFDEAAYIIANPQDISRLFLVDVNSPLNIIQPDVTNLESPPNLVPPLSSPTNITNTNPPNYVDRPEQVDASANLYIGAFRPGGLNWMQGWTNFPAN